MSFLPFLTLRASVLAFVALAALGGATLGGLSWRQIDNSQALGRAMQSDLDVQRAAGTLDMLHDGLLATTRAARLAGASATEGERSQVRAELAEMREGLQQALDAVTAGTDRAAVRVAAEALRPELMQYSQTAQRLVDAALAGTAGAAVLQRDFEARFRQLAVSLEQLSGLIEAAAADRLAERDALFAHQRQATLVAGTVMVATLLLLGLRFAASLRRRLGAEPPALRRFAEGIAIGALDTQLPAGTAAPAPGSVAAALLAMRDQLAAMVCTLRDGADSVATGSSQIASGNQDLAERTVRQASSVQSTAASMAQMTALVQQSAAQAEAASQLAEGSRSVAERGGVAVQQVVATMQGLAEGSRRIGEITGLIDAIAAQSSILAMNASVEAVRAGREGHGFVAVAAEVRALAHKTAQAAREIRKLAEHSQRQVSDSCALAAQAGSTMGEVSAQAEQVHALIAGISQAVREQAQGIASVGGSVAVLDAGTQQNAALVEQSAAAATMLREQAARLAEVVAGFRLGARG